MYDETQIWFVEPHTQCGGGDHGLDPVVQQVGLDRLARSGLGAPGVGDHRMAGRAQQRRDVLRRGHGEHVDDSGTGQLIEVRAEPGHPLLRGRKLQHPKVQRVAVQRSAEHQRVPADGDGELLGDVAHHPVVRGRRRGEHGHPGR